MILGYTSVRWIIIGRGFTPIFMASKEKRFDDDLLVSACCGAALSQSCPDPDLCKFVCPLCGNSCLPAYEQQRYV